MKFQLLQLDYETCGPYFDEDNAVFLVYHCLELLQDGVIHGEVRWRITGVNQLEKGTHWLDYKRTLVLASPL